MISTLVIVVYLKSTPPRNPAFAIIDPVLLFKWHPSATNVCMGLRICCCKANPPSFSDKTCSQNTKMPPGFSTRLISDTALSGFVTEQRVRVTTTASTEASANGRASATPCTILRELLGDCNPDFSALSIAYCFIESFGSWYAIPKSKYSQFNSRNNPKVQRTYHSNDI